MAWLHDSLWRAYDVLALSILPQFENFQVGSEWSPLWPFFFCKTVQTLHMCCRACSTDTGNDL